MVPGDVSWSSVLWMSLTIMSAGECDSHTSAPVVGKDAVENGELYHTGEATAPVDRGIATSEKSWTLV